MTVPRGLPFYIASQQPELADLLALVKRDILLSLNCHAVGTVKAFNPLTQQATVEIAYTRTYYVRPEQDYETAALAPESRPPGIYTPKEFKYPVLVEVPVMFLGGGTGNLTFPVDTGDACLLLFNDRDIDNWYSGTTGAAVSSTRLHALADAVALVGLRALPDSLPAFDPSRTVLSQGPNARVAVDDDGVYLEFGDPLGGAARVFKVDKAGVHWKLGASGDVTLDVTNNGIAIAIGSNLTIGATADGATIKYGSAFYAIGKNGAPHQITDGTNQLGAQLAQLTSQLQQICTQIDALGALAAGLVPAGASAVDPSAAGKLTPIKIAVDNAAQAIGIIGTNIAGILQ